MAVNEYLKEKEDFISGSTFCRMPQQLKLFLHRYGDMLLDLVQNEGPGIHTFYSGIFENGYSCIFLLTYYATRRTAMVWRHLERTGHGGGIRKGRR